MLFHTASVLGGVLRLSFARHTQVCSPDTRHRISPVAEGHNTTTHLDRRFRSSLSLSAAFVTSGVAVNNGGSIFEESANAEEPFFDMEWSRRGCAMCAGDCAGQEAAEPAGDSERHLRGWQNRHHQLQPAVDAQPEDLWRAGPLR